MSLSLDELGIENMTVPERLELIGLIWDSITDTGTQLPIPESHIEVLKLRRAAAEADPDAAIPWDEVKARLLNRP